MNTPISIKAQTSIKSTNKDLEWKIKSYKTVLDRQRDSSDNLRSPVDLQGDSSRPNKLPSNSSNNIDKIPGKQEVKEIKKKIETIYQGKVRPKYNGDLPKGNDGLGLMLLLFGLNKLATLGSNSDNLPHRHSLESSPLPFH